MKWDHQDAIREFYSEITHAPVTLNGAPFGKFSMALSREQSLSETGGFWAIKLQLGPLEPETIPNYDRTGRKILPVQNFCPLFSV